MMQNAWVYQSVNIIKVSKLVSKELRISSRVGRSIEINWSSSQC